MSARSLEFFKFIFHHADSHCTSLVNNVFEPNNVAQATTHKSALYLQQICKFKFKNNLRLPFFFDCIIACSRVCQNGGTLDNRTCMCDCAGGFSGANCESECSEWVQKWIDTGMSRICISRSFVIQYTVEFMAVSTFKGWNGVSCMVNVESFIALREELLAKQ